MKIFLAAHPKKSSRTSACAKIRDDGCFRPVLTSDLSVSHFFFVLVELTFQGIYHIVHRSFERFVDGTGE